MTTGEYIGGFRVVRTLGVGGRSEVLLGHGGEERTAALKVFAATTSTQSIDTEIEALSRADHAHALQLRDVSTAPGGLPCLILERLGHGSLAQLLATRSALAPGEAVTVLAPVVAAVGALHSSGVAHGRIGAGSVLFRESGAPVLASFGHSTLLDPQISPLQLAGSRGVLEDRIAIGRLAATVLARVTSLQAGELSVWLGLLEREGFPDGFTTALEQRVFELADASPVRFAPEAADRAPAALPQRVHTAEPVLLHEAVLEVVAPPTALLSLSGIRGLVTERLPVLGALTLPDLRSVRRPIWIAAGIGVASLVTALLLVPPGSGGAAAPVPSATSVTPHSGSVDGAVTGDDPVAALGELLEARTECVRQLSILCLENAVQSGSAAMDDDVELIRSIEDGSTSGTLAGPPGEMVLVERDGDAALVRYTWAPNSEPASVLLVKGEAGWRIRDYIPSA